MTKYIVEWYFGVEATSPLEAGKKVKELLDRYLKGHKHEADIYSDDLNTIRKP